MTESHQVLCSVCESPDHVVVRQARAETNGGTGAVYSASSDHILVDQLVQCRRCGLVYVNPRLPEATLVNLYSDAVDPTFVEQNPERIRTFRRSLGAICRKLNTVPRSELRVLDVGCGGGAFLKAAADMGFSVLGIEPSRWLAQHARQQYGVEVRQGTLADGDFPDASFDIVSMWDVIEHLSNPHNALETIGRCIKPGGLLIVNFPDVGSWAARLLGERWPFYLSVHLSYYTRETIARQLDRASFEVRLMRPHWQQLKLGYVLQRLGHYSAAGRVLGGVARKFGLCNMKFTYSIGQTLVVAQKK